MISTALFLHIFDEKIYRERGRGANRYTLAPELLKHLGRQRFAAAHAGR